MNITKRISDKLGLKPQNINAAITLIDEGSTIPFIARYRKEVVGNLTDAELRDLHEELTYLRKLEERMITVIKSLEEQEKLTKELAEAIDNVTTLSELEDIYRPYKPKRKTRATIAISKGLAPLAEYLKLGIKRKDHDAYVASFVNLEKDVKSEEEALNGASDIIAEEISDEAKYRAYIKRFINNNAMITSKEVSKDEKDTFGQYASYQEKVKTIPPHRILALYRGEKLKHLKITLDYEVEHLEEKIGFDYLPNNAFSSLLSLTIKDSLKRLVLPSVENETRTDLFTKAEDASLVVFKKNLSALLLYPPLKNKMILGFDPGFRTGAKYAVVDKSGIMLKVGIVFLVASSDHQKESAKNEIISLLKTYDIDYIALGNGTASRESEEELRAILKTHNFKTKLFIVNESGASVYSASKLAQEEFPELTVEKRSAISLARRLQDPLSELVKIDPKAIGVGQYQHDMNQTRLSETLHGVVEDAVNTVGVNLNNASVSLLNYVSGINKTISQNIYDYMLANGPFKSRKELLKVNKLGAKAYEQCAGFLRIFGGKEELDATAIHPESYDAAKFIISQTKINLFGHTSEEKKLALLKLDENEVMKKFNLGKETYIDIIEELLRPGRDIREDVALVELNNEVRDLKDLKVGMILNGTVRNIMDFGLFVDINVGQDGLVHISEVANHYVKDISSLYTINDIVKVKVIGVDSQKQRISLSLKQVS